MLVEKVFWEDNMARYKRIDARPKHASLDQPSYFEFESAAPHQYIEPGPFHFRGGGLRSCGSRSFKVEIEACRWRATCLERPLDVRMDVHRQILQVLDRQVVEILVSGGDQMTGVRGQQDVTQICSNLVERAAPRARGRDELAENLQSAMVPCILPLGRVGHSTIALFWAVFGE